LTVRGNHLQCDGRNNCAACSSYTWSNNIEQPMRYYYCKYCNTDILCKLGAAVNYDYEEEGIIVKIIKCNKCGEPLAERVWPKVKEVKI